MYMDYKEIDFEIQRRDDLIDSLKEENRKLKDVLHATFIDLDWDTVSKLAVSNGMNCEEFVNITRGKKL